MKALFPINYNKKQFTLQDKILLYFFVNFHFIIFVLIFKCVKLFIFTFCTQIKIRKKAKKVERKENLKLKLKQIKIPTEAYGKDRGMEVKKERKKSQSFEVFSFL